ncbi:TetR/AcrR family transcriptional regulator [Streptomyces sp. MST-110588]|nr:TetR/AcrR family transcriptional regulator [Streptomyces sp. MST-110588]UNO44248.1 TetR/AcrR family transcriptional regulator [Streptomyces sp. MST-110588]
MSRRERLRAEATREITAIALEQMAADGPGAISLRGIAREMGMTPRAIYGYFATRDELITALADDIASSLADTLEAARDAAAVTDPRRRLLAWGLALREWALANPEGFRLVYGDPVPGYQPPAGDGPAERAARRICGGLNRLVAEVASTAGPGAYAPAAGAEADSVKAGEAEAEADGAEADEAEADGFGWSDFPEEYLAKVRAEVPDLSPAVVALALRAWGRMHGLVTLEIHGHLGAVTRDPAALYRAEMLDLIRSVGGSSC